MGCLWDHFLYLRTKGHENPQTCNAELLLAAAYLVGSTSAFNRNAYNKNKPSFFSCTLLRGALELAYTSIFP